MQNKREMTRYEVPFDVVCFSSFLLDRKNYLDKYQNYISFHVSKISEISRVPSTRNITDIFNTFDEAKMKKICAVKKILD